jgi:hypothetical protein
VAIQFPNNPGIGSVFTDTDAGFSYEWTGVVWKSFTPAAANNIKELDDISSSFDNSTTTFNLTISGAAYQPRSAAMLQISLGGVIQEPGTDYTVSTSTITFTTAPNAGLDFFGVVRGTAVAIDYANDGNVQTKQEFTATEGQTSFTITGGYTAGYIDVFRNGVRLAADDITITSGTVVVLATPAQAGDIIETVKYKVASIVTTEGQFTNLNISGIATVGILTGATSVQSTTYYGDGSNLTGIDATALKDSGGNVKVQANPNGIQITGIATASSGFVGNLTGNADTANSATTASSASALSGTPDITVNNVTGAAATFSGSVNANSFTGDGSGLTGVANTDFIVGTSITMTSGNFTGNVTIGGTLTYQDVESIDSIGIITAQQGIQILANGLNVVSGVATVGIITGVTSVGGGVYYGDGSQLTGISVGIATESITATDQSIATLNLSKDAHKVKVSGVATIDCQGGSEYETHILTIENTGIATVGFSTYFLFPSGAEPSLPTASGAISQLSFTVHRVGAAGTQVLTTVAVNFS